MTTSPAPTAPLSTEAPGWFGRAEAWLDARGKGAWIAVLIFAFIFFWPIGLALLAYLIWSNRMFTGSCAHRRHHRANGMKFRSSGNSAFDAYKADTLKRLENEQSAFEEFLQRLRDAKDKAEFDQFMEDRKKAADGDNAEA